jgi:hypothetical protein
MAYKIEEDINTVLYFEEVVSNLEDFWRFTEDNTAFKVSITWFQPQVLQKYCKTFSVQQENVGHSDVSRFVLFCCSGAEGGRRRGKRNTLAFTILIYIQQQATLHSLF